MRAQPRPMKSKASKAFNRPPKSPKSPKKRKMSAPPEIESKNSRNTSPKVPHKGGSGITVVSTPAKTTRPKARTDNKLQMSLSQKDLI